MNETLLAQLDDLRDSYIQRRKAAATLLAAFKATTDAQSKVVRGLRDYAAQNTRILPEKLGQTQAAFGASRLKEDAIDPLVPDLRREIKSVTTLTNALRDAATALRSEPTDVVRLDRARAALTNANQEDIQAILPDLHEEFAVAQRALGDEFGQALRAALAEQGVTVVGRSPHFQLGRFELEADFGKRFAILRYGKDVVVPRIPLTAEAVVRAYQGAFKTVTGRNEDGQKWMAQFYEAYQRTRRKLDVGGSRVNIVDCYVEVSLLRQGRTWASQPSKRSFSDYLRAQFIFDFYRFAQQQRIGVQGKHVRAHVATKSQVDNPAKSMWIVEGDSPYDGRYIADVEFEGD